MIIGREKPADHYDSHHQMDRSGRNVSPKLGTPNFNFRVSTRDCIIQWLIPSEPLGDLDTWFYYGHFTTKLGLYRDVNPFIEHDYYQTRLSFILPGWFIFHVFSTFVARVIHYYIYYIVISFSLLYVLSMNTSGAAALLATIMLGTDIYFIRSAGWNYVDIGVLCYLSLTFVSLTAAVRSIRPELWVATAGFCFACAVVTHLGSIVAAVPVVGYAWYSFRF